MLTIVSLSLLFAGTTGALLLPTWLAARAPGGDPLPPEEMRRHVVWRSFYVNPDDPRGWVPKLSGTGWTVNFRSRANATVFGVFLGMTLVGAAGLILAALQQPTAG